MAVCLTRYLFPTHTHICLTLLCQVDNLFLTIDGWAKLGDFGEVSYAALLLLLCASTHTPPRPTQALSDYGEARAFFDTDGTPWGLQSKQPLQRGAPIAKSPELVAALAGPLQQGARKWELFRGWDTWAAGRMMYVLLLQCIHRKPRSIDLGLPQLNKDPHALKELPGYSGGLRRILGGMMAFDPAQRLSPEQALVRCQVLLWGGDGAATAAAGAGASAKVAAKLTASSSEADAAAWLQWQRRRVCSALAESATQPGVEAGGGAGAGATDATAGGATAAAGATAGAGRGAGAGGPAAGASSSSRGGMNAALASLANGGSGIVRDHVAGSLWAAFIGSATASDVAAACSDVLE